MLREILERFGREICDDPARLKAVLCDYAGGRGLDRPQREIRVLVEAAEERVPGELLRCGDAGSRGVVQRRLAARLQQSFAITEEYARWAVATWASALGLAEIAASRGSATVELGEQPAEAEGFREQHAAARPNQTLPSTFVETQAAGGGVTRAGRRTSAWAWGRLAVMVLLAAAVVGGWKWATRPPPHPPEPSAADSKSPVLLPEKSAFLAVEKTPDPQPPAAGEVEALFTVREGGTDGAELAGAEVQLRWLAGEGAASAVLGRGTTDSRGKVRIKAGLGGAQWSRGSYEVLLSSGGTSKIWPLPAFPHTLEWEVWLAVEATGSGVGSKRSSEPPPLAVAPFDATAAREYQEAWARHQGMSLEITNSIGMKLRLISDGEFLMGSQETEEGHTGNEGPVHRLRITKPFYLGVYEVTQADYENVVGENPSEFKGAARPVECVSWEDAVAFCRKLSAKEGQEYRLPTEAEWEYACRAGTTTPFSFGSVLKGQEANCDGNYPYGTTTKGPFLGRTTKVGSYAANAFGLYDMHGNVWEWCADWYDAEYYKHSPSEDPPGAASGSYRVYRGGGWFLDASGCRASCRRGGVPGYRGAILGFRLARTVSSR
jgi:formylglycine-generating enzyme required for sulfatase activity